LVVAATLTSNVASADTFGFADDPNNFIALSTYNGFTFSGNFVNPILTWMNGSTLPIDSWGALPPRLTLRLVTLGAITASTLR
jgi:hypothetical protein